MNEAIERVKAAVLALADPSWVQGNLSTKDLSIGGHAVDKKLAAALVKNAEPAPFGHKQQTKLDEKVRSTLRLKSRGRTKVTGTDLAPILEQISDTLATPTTLEAKLLDVLVYPKGGKFLRHKDTPRSAEQLGTLIVEVPFAHEGGVMTLDDHSEKLALDWSVPAKQARWVALFGDVDHEIAKVTSGHRITIVYTLTLTKQKRTSATQQAKLETLTDAIITLSGVTFGEDDWEAPNAIYVPCTRMANAPVKGKVTIKMLRGNDRLIADAFAACELPTTVSEVLVPQGHRLEPGQFPTSIETSLPLKQPIPPAAYRGADMMSFTTSADGEYLDEIGDVDVAKIGKYVDKHVWGRDEWLVRPKAEATLMWSGMYSENGYFGNEVGDGQIYKTVAIRVDLSALRKKKKATSRGTRSGRRS